MKQLALFILILLIACNQQKKLPANEIYDNVEKARSFAFVNSDSMKYYRRILQQICNPAIEHQKAVLKYIDGLYFLTAGIHNKSVAGFNEALAIFEKEKEEKFSAYCVLGLSNCYKIMGDFDQAILYYQRALSMFEKMKDAKFVTVCYAGLAETYELKDDPEKAEPYIKQAKLKEPYGTKTYAALLHVQANLYGMKQRTDSALLTDREGLKIADSFHYPEMKSSFYDNIALCYCDRKDYDSSEYYFKQCIAADSANGRIQLMADTYAKLVGVYGYKNEEDKMTATAAYAYHLCDSTQYIRGKYSIFEGLNNYYSSAKNWQKAAEAKDSMRITYEKMINEETEQKITEYNIEFETGRKEQLIGRQQADLQRAAYITMLMSAVAMLLIISIIALYRNYKARKTIAVNKAIQEQKDRNVQAVFESEQAERIRIARDLHDSIGQKLSVLKMYLTSNKDDVKVTALLDDTIREVREVSHNLLPEELNFGFRKAMESDLEKMRSACNFIIKAAFENAGAYDTLPLLSSLNILRIFRELMSNMVKHSRATEVQVSAIIKENEFMLELKDNGIGIDQKKMEESDGIGWKNIYARVNMMKGKIAIDENAEGGNTVTIKIPIS